MRNLILILLLFVSSLVSAQIFTVVQCYDADSFAAIEETTGQRIEIRLSGIDGPEKHQPYYKEGKAYLEKLILNKNVDLRIVCYDQYFRMVANVVIGNVWVNKELVLKGYCFVYDKYCTEKQLYDAQTLAKKDSLNIWRSKSIVKPWDFRKSYKHFRS